VRRPRFVLFSSRGAAFPPNVVGRALAAIPSVSVLATPTGHVVRDEGTGYEIHVTLADGPLIAADVRALAAEHWRDQPEERAEIAAADARFEIRYPDEDAAINPMLLVQDALERLTGGFGYDLDFNRISIAREGESIVTDVGPEQRAEDERLMAEIEAMTPEELDRDLASEGLDVEASRKEGAEFIARMFKQREIRDALSAALDRVAPNARESRGALLAKLAAARAEPAIGGALGWLLRDRGIATMSDGEVQAVVDEVAKWREG
jgi:hypothetical protein